MLRKALRASDEGSRKKISEPVLGQKFAAKQNIKSNIAFFKNLKLVNSATERRESTRKSDSTQI